MKAPTPQRWQAPLRLSGLLAALLAGLCLDSASAALPLELGPRLQTSSLTAAGNSYNPVFSADGRLLVFISQANNLVTNDNAGPNLDLFAYDLIGRVNILVSVSASGVGGANMDANCPSLSSDARYIAFESAASNLVTNDFNRANDVFVRDLLQGVTRLVSVERTGGQSGNGDSGGPVITPDGRWIVFESAATNLVYGQFRSNLTQVYLADWQANDTRLVSINRYGTGPGDGAAESPTISDDGRWIAFSSKAANLVPGPMSLLGEIYLRDMQTETTIRASSNAAPYFAGVTGGYRCFNPVLSGDGRMLAFKAASPGTNLVLVFLTDLTTGDSTCVASNSFENSWPELTADGRYLAYEDGTNVLVWSAREQTNRLISVSFDGQSIANAPSHRPVLTADGKTVVFLSRATDLITSSPPPDAFAACQVYARSLESNATWLVSLNPDGQPSRDALEYILPAISPSGRTVAFESPDAQIVGGDENRACDIFLRNLETGLTDLVTARHDGGAARTGTGNCYVHPLGLSADGRIALISSTDTTLDAADTNYCTDLYWVDLAFETNLLLSIPTNSLNPFGRSLDFPSLSADGRRAAFLRLPSEGYVFDRETGALSLFNLGHTGQVANACFDPDYDDWSLSLGPDGRWLAFSARGSEWVADMANPNNRANIFLRDLDAGTNALVTKSALSSLAGGSRDSVSPLFSPDGRWLSFFSWAGDLVTNGTSGRKLWAYDLSQQSLRLISANSAAAGPVYSANSQYLTFYTEGASANEVYRHDLLATDATNLLVATNARRPSLSADGQLVAFQSYLAGQASDIYVKDLASGNLELISVGTDGLAGGDASSSDPQISPNGRWVVFASKAGNLVLGDTNGVSDVFLRDRLEGLTYLVSANPKNRAAGDLSSGSPVMSADGSTVLFASWAGDLIEGDYNGQRDIFVLKLSTGDSDTDGLDDTWELAYFGDLSRDGSGDADGDGAPDRKELRAGTDPTSQGSALRALLVSSVGGKDTTLMWPAKPGRQYKVQFKRSLDDPTWNDLDVLVNLSGNTASATDTEGGLGSTRFYRIAILP